MTDRSFFLLLNKPEGMSSNIALQKTKRVIFKEKVKAGYAGTLDPLATGLLIIAFNRATKFLDFIVSNDKEYIATIALGSQTTTDDREGVVLFKKDNKDTPQISTKEVIDVLNTFKGDIDQIPPIYSALKINGRRMYDMARKGELIKPIPRKVTINRIELLECSKTSIKLLVNCSKGTYIRS